MMTVQKQHSGDERGDRTPDESMLYQILEAAAHLTGARSAFIERLDPLTHETWVVVTYGLPAVQAGDPAERSATPSRLTFPLTVGGDRVGALVCLDVPATVTLDPTQPGQIELLTALASTALRNMQLAQQLERATSAAMERRFRLLNGLVHYLKNTLGAAGEYVQLLEMESDLTHRQQQFMSASQRNIDGAIRLLNELIDLSRVETGRFAVEREPIDPALIVRGLLRDYEMLNATSGVRFGLDQPHALPVIETDVNLVRRILDTLLSNAVKYTPAGGYVWVRADVRAGRRLDDPRSWLCISVHDDGPGVPDRDLVFEEVIRAESNTTMPGFRLAISRRIARLLGGDLTLDPRDGGGSSFSLWLPTP
ncbi:MAG TPA: HAMP domain-containing sensor histidine kinase [Longimicrobiales bacterium]